LEPTPSTPGAVADHRLALAPDEIEQFAQTLAARLAREGQANGVAPPSRVEQAWFDAVVEDLLAHRGASIIIAGEHTSPRLQTLAHAMNVALGNVGRTVVYTEPVEAQSIDHMQSLRELVVGMRAGRVQTLVIL